MVSTLKNQANRIEIIDIIRAFALFGILFANIFVRFSGTETLPTTPVFEQLLSYTLVRGKFYSIFSFLFGVGFGLQLLQANHDKNFLSLYQRRISILFCIGIIHMFVWFGDILMLYALLAFALIAFRKQSDRFFLIASLLCLLFPIVIEGVRLIIFQVSGGTDIFSPLLPQPGHSINELIKVYGYGDFYQIFINNLGMIKHRWSAIITSSREFRVFGLFLLGYFCAKKGFFSRSDVFNKHIHLICFVGLFGLTMSALLALLETKIIPIHSAIWLDFYKNLTYTLGTPTLALFYVSVLLLAYKNRRVKKIMSFFAPAGKMALTNYLLQTAICLTLFCHFGWFGKINTTGCLLITILIYSTQLVFSSIWLRYYQLGPSEWVWRSLANGKIGTLRKAT